MNAQSFQVVPHPFELIEGAKEFSDQKKVISDTLKKFQDEDVSTLLLLQSHGGLYPEAPSFHIPQEGHYEDVRLQSGVACDRELASQIQKSFFDYDRRHHVLEVETLSPVAVLMMKICEELDYQVSFVVMSVSFESLEQQYKTGSLIRRALLTDSSKVGVLVSGHLSHCLSKESAAGYIPGAKDWSQQMFAAMNSSKPEKFLYEDSLTRQEMGEDLTSPFVMGLGILDAFESGWKSELSYHEEKGIAFVDGKVTKKEA